MEPIRLLARAAYLRRIRFGASMRQSPCTTGLLRRPHYCQRGREAVSGTCGGW
jgi:hypothetical protein